MDQSPIQRMMQTTMDSLRDMVDVNTVIGDPVMATDGTTVIPVSKVCFGFVSGGGEYACGQAKKAESAGSAGELPFAGGAGAGVTVQPMGFLVMNEAGVKLIPAQNEATLDRMIELIPKAVSDISRLFTGGANS